VGGLDLMRITLDTNVLDPPCLQQMLEAAAGLSAEFAMVTVSKREIEGTRIQPLPTTVLETGVWGESRSGEFLWGVPVAEPLVLGESRLGEGALSGPESANRFEAILRIVSNGAFPKPGVRDTLKPGERRQMRDAMILEAHARESRDILVTNEIRAYGRTGDQRRRRLETLCATHIMNVDEFCEHCRKRRIKNVFEGQL